MSRTDVHAPDWVKERDPLWRANYVEDHNHSWYVTGHEKVTDSAGVVRWVSIWKRVERCDLDVYLEDTNHRVRTACSVRFVYTGQRHCGCKMCTGQISRRLDRRSERRRAKRLIKVGRWEEVSFPDRSRLSW